MATTVLSLLALFLSCTFLPSKSAAPPPPSASPASPQPSCTDELVLFSPCLSYVSSPPNDLADAASANCCNAFSSATNSGAALCFCYLLREPPILGFPLNSTRLLSLSSVCPPANRTSARAPSLNSLCSESSTLPPLNNSATLGLTSPSITGPRSEASPSARILPKGGGGGRSAGGSNGGRSSGNSDGGERSTSTPSKGGGTSGLLVAGARSSETRICSSRSWLLASTLNIFVSLLTATL